MYLLSISAITSAIGMKSSVISKYEPNLACSVKYMLWVMLLQIIILQWTDSIQSHKSEEKQQNWSTVLAWLEPALE